jgi:putative glutamine transport system substrate-binding protein
MKRYKRRAAARILMVWAVTTLCLFACGASPEKSSQVQAIRKRGVLRVGLETNVPGFGYLAPGAAFPEGLEPDIARIAAEAMLGDETAVQYIPVTPQIRGPLLDNGAADFVIAHYTITEERRKQYNFTSSYYTDEVGIMVRKDSGIRSLGGLDGCIIGVTRAATSQTALEAEAAKLGIALTYAEFASHPEAVSALHAGKTDAFVIDKIILRAYLDDRTVLLDEGFNPQSYGIATKLDNDKLAAYLDGIVTDMRNDGRLDALIAKWGL